MKSDQPPPPIYNQQTYAPPPPSGPGPGSFDSRPVNQQYRSHAAPAFNPTFNPAVNPLFAPKPKPEEPQYARFESQKPVNEDALPAMPSWSDAKVSHVEEEVIPEKQNNIEMDRLDQNGSVAGSSMTGAAVAGAPRRSPGPGRSPVPRMQTQDPYGFPAGYHNDSYANNAPPHDPRNSPRPQDRYYGQEQGVYRGVSPIQASAPSYGAGAGYAHHQQYDDQSPTAGYAPPRHYDQQSPAPNYTQTQNYGRGSPGPNYAQEQFRRPSPAHSPSPVNPYGYSAPRPQEAHYTGNNVQHNDGYAPSESTRYEPSPAPSYPGQQAYASEPAYPGQQGYQAFNPGQPQGQQHSGVTRKAAPGSWREV
jgi:hypothetical protein